jgi:hypothetical protein
MKFLLSKRNQTETYATYALTAELSVRCRDGRLWGTGFLAIISPHGSELRTMEEKSD